jgi:hypothetical protein
MSKLIDLTGQQFGRLTPLDRAPNKSNLTMWRCSCECGNETVVYGQHLRDGKTQSCGCLQQERSIKHGHCAGGKRSREYQKWCSAKARCYCPGAGGFRNYGGREISMYPEWRYSFIAFYRDMGPCPEWCSLDRFDVDGNYEPGNCRWATRTEQARNRRNNRYLEYDGVRQTLTEWAGYLGTSLSALGYRLKHGHTLAELVEAHRMPLAA